MININTYTDKSFVVRGDTKEYKEELKNLSGKWNSNLKGGSGWIFSNIHKDKVQNWISNLQEKKTELETYDENKIISVRLYKYSEKSFVVRGDTKEIKDTFKEFGGKWNSNLKDGGGWIFSNNKKDKVIEWLDNNNNIILEDEFYQ